MKNNKEGAPIKWSAFFPFGEGNATVSENGEWCRKIWILKGVISLNATEKKIKLSKVESHHLTSLKQFTLHEQQLAFTSMPMPAFEKCMREPNRLPVVIMEGDRIVGFFVLDQGGDVLSYTTNPHAILLRAYSINLPDQGRGIAKASLRQLKSFVEKHLPDCREVVLGVNEDNPLAKNVYLGAGFIDTVEQKMGRSGSQAILKFLI